MIAPEKIVELYAGLMVWGGRAMSTNGDVKDLARRWMEAWKRDISSAVDAFLDPDFIDHSAPPDMPPGRETARQTYLMMAQAFPDIDFTIEDIVAVGDRVGVRTSWRATHTGPLMGLPPTGKQVRWGSMTIMRVRDGKFVEHWGAFDQFGIMQQLGVIPTPGQNGQ